MFICLFDCSAYKFLVLRIGDICSIALSSMHGEVYKRPEVSPTLLGVDSITFGQKCFTIIPCSNYAMLAKSVLQEKQLKWTPKRKDVQWYAQVVVKCFL